MKRYIDVETMINTFFETEKQYEEDMIIPSWYDALNLIDDLPRVSQLDLVNDFVTKLKAYILDLDIKLDKKDYTKAVSDMFMFCIDETLKEMED